MHRCTHLQVLNDGHVYILLRQHRCLRLLPLLLGRLLPPLAALPALGIRAAAPGAAGSGSCLHSQLRLALLVKQGLDVCREGERGGVQKCEGLAGRGDGGAQRSRAVVRGPGCSSSTVQRHWPGDVQPPGMASKAASARL